MRYVDGVVDGLAPHLSRPTLVVGKSTVPVGTAARLADRLAELAPAGSGAELAWNPEFLREGFAVEDTLRPDRLVIGVRSAGAEQTLREVYAQAVAAGTPFIVTDFATAELVKASANAFLATKISFINAMAELCEASGADVTQLADAIGHDSRIGRKFLNAGLGFGGGCLPKDIRAFMARAGELGVDQALSFLREIDAINLRRRAHVANLAREACGGSFLGKRVAVLGASFKPNSDDVRDSPALAVAGQIQLQGATVTVYDPRSNENARAVFPTLGYADSAQKACADADLVLHLTEWQEFRDIDPTVLADVVAERSIIDARNALDPVAWRAAGWTYRSLGRP
jgi:UDPglucose 6-dehydrogenase